MASKQSRAAKGESDGPDPRFLPVIAAFARTPGFSLMESKTGATRGLMLHGKSFGMSTHGRFMLKLNDELVTELVSEGIGKPFSPGAGRVLKGWIEVTREDADWVALARQAHRLAAQAHQPSASKKSKRV